MKTSPSSQASPASNRSMRVASRTYSPMPQSAMASLSCCEDDCCTEERRGNNEMTYVGQGQGDFKASDTYRYVGKDGDKPVVVVNEDTACRRCCLCLLFLSLVATVVVGTASVFFHNRRPDSFTEANSFPEKYDCSSDDDSEMWSSAQEDWCCEKLGRGCQRIASNPYDCLADYDGYEKLWSRAKKEWCCENRNRGCEAHEFDCTEDYANWQRDWTKVKQKWCCDNRHLGCPGTNPYDCEDGFSNWKLGWSDAKKEWCCKHQSRACSRACESQCTYRGHTATCAQRIRWATSHNETIIGKSNACNLALDLIQVQCDVCDECTLAEVGCSGGSTDSGKNGGDEYNCALLPYNLWSSNQSVWCCQEYGVGCSSLDEDDKDVVTTTSNVDAVNTTSVVAG